MRKVAVICALLALAGCTTSEDTGAVAARMEAHHPQKQIKHIFVDDVSIT